MTRVRILHKPSGTVLCEAVESVAEYYEVGGYGYRPHNLAALNLTVEPIEEPKKKRLLAWRCRQHVYSPSSGEVLCARGTIILRDEGWENSDEFSEAYWLRAKHLDEPEEP